MANEEALRQKIGQRIMTGLPGPELDPDFIRMVKTFKISNVVLFRRNIQGTPQLSRLCGDIQELVRQETGHGALIAVDQEGGIVTRLGADGINIPGAMAIAATGDPGNAYDAGLITGRELKRLGVNFNFAPVLDVNSNPENPLIGVRSYGDTPETVVRFGLEMMRGLTDAGILCCAKHFPGHGDTSVDSHLGLPRVDKSLSDLLQTELVPFQAAIGRGLPCIMSAHILFPELEKNGVPATLSREILTNLLKNRLGFGGLISTDCLEMNAIQSYYGTVKGAVMAAQAGADLILISHSGELASQAALALRDALLSGELDPAEFDASVGKILSLKARYAVPEDGRFEQEPSRARQRVREIREAGITPVRAPGGTLPPLGDRPCFLGDVPGTVAAVADRPDSRLDFALHLSGKLGGRAVALSEDPTDGEIDLLARQVSGSTCLVVGLDNGKRNPALLRLSAKCADTGIPVLAVALRSPYVLRGLDSRFALLCTYEYSAAAFDALAEVLAGRRAAAGRLPISLK